MSKTAVSQSLAEVLFRPVLNERVGPKLLARRGFKDLLLRQGHTWRVLLRVLESPELSTPLLEDRGFWERFFGDRVLDSVPATAAFFQHLEPARLVDRVLSEEATLSGVLSHPRTADHLLAHPQLLAPIFSHPRTVDHLLAHPQLLAPIFSHPRTAGALIAHESLLERLFKHPAAVERIKSRPELQRLVLMNRPAMDMLITAPQFPKALFAHPGVLRVLFDDERLARHTPLARHLKAVAAFEEAWAKVAPVVNTDRPDFAERWAEARQGLEQEGQVAERILELICEGDAVHLAGGTLRFPDRRSLWVVIHEILVNEEYYFPCESDSPRILDCGAHAGMATYYFKRLYPSARITAFEPVPQLSAIARANMEANGFGDVEVLPYALAEHEGTARLKLLPEDSMSASLLSRTKDDTAGVEEVEVPCQRLSAYLDEPVDFLKLDIEGPELEVLEEAGEKLRQVHYLFCEYHQGEGLPAERLARLLTLLTALGFDVQVGKSHSYQSATARRPTTYFDSNYSGCIWGKNRRWG